MFKIGEFSRLTQVSVRMLRYYDACGILKPAQIDTFTGYRLYSTEQIPILQKIVFLRDLGFGVSEIAGAIPDWENASIAERLMEKKSEIELAVSEGRDRIARIETALMGLRRKKPEIRCDVMIKRIPEYPVLSLRRRIPNYFSEGLLWQELSTFSTASRADVTDICFALYHDLDYREKDVDVEVCTVVEKWKTGRDAFIYRNTEQVDEMACMMVSGPFENIAGAFQSLADWLTRHEIYQMAPLANRQMVYRGPWNEEDPEKYLTEIQIPLQKKL